MESGSEPDYGESLIDVINEEVSEEEEEEDDGTSSGGGAQPAESKKKKNRRKRKHKKQHFIPKSECSNINRFVLDACKHLKEKKAYKLYQAVTVLGVSGVNDFIKQVDDIQASGGQMTKAGDRLKMAGGVFWSLIKSQNPAAYKSIMDKIKDFEAQLTAAPGSTSQS